MPENDWKGNSGALYDNAFPGWAKFGEAAATNAPGPIGAAAKLIKNGNSYGKDGTPLADIGTIISDASSLITSCTGMALNLRVDPLGWLINQGVSFLVNVITPIKAAIDLVSGNPDALSASAKNFNELSKELLALNKEFSAALSEELKGWEGIAAETARARLRQFENGVRGVAGQSGDIAMALQTSSMVMKVVEDFLKGLLTDVVEWLVITWVAALATAPATLGASTAAASALTTAKVGQKTAQTSAVVTKTWRFIELNQNFMKRTRQRLADSDWTTKFLNEGTGKGGKRAPDFHAAVETAAKDQAMKLVGLDKTKLWEESGKKDEKLEFIDPGKIIGKVSSHGKSIQLGHEYDKQGDSRPVEETKKDLDI
ncbi:WXG100 family type VII secretion target [Allokutzneria albata]|uniref:Uncharacterized protein n=1 Tax=Allokutzneria albata TaxID=211114 RepID=A0A1G9Z194_ALLAB|nr:hypothetical protein [Allokutzneria albata]SDN14473.1 hypothetical protein SAMN04489726_5158 [Allokutzneria albata]